VGEHATNLIAQLHNGRTEGGGPIWGGCGACAQLLRTQDRVRAGLDVAGGRWQERRGGGGEIRVLRCLRQLSAWGMGNN